MLDFVPELVRFIYEKEGLMGLIGVVVAVIITIEFSRRFFTALFRKFPTWFSAARGRPSVASLRNDAVIKTYDRHLKHEFENIHIECPLRKRLFLRLLTYRTQAKKESLLYMLTPALDDMSGSQLEAEMHNFFVESDAAWLRECKFKGVPDIAIAKFKQHCETDQDFLRSISIDICRSARLYRSNRDKMQAICVMLNAEEQCTLLSVERTIDDLNGELSKIEFEGIRCQECSPDCRNKVKRAQEDPHNHVRRGVLPA